MNQLEIFPINTIEDFKKSMEFLEKNNEIIQNIKSLFYKNLSEQERKKFLEINKDINNIKNEDFQDYNNYSDEQLINQYITVSLIKNTINQSKNDIKYEMVLFIPTENGLIKKSIINLIKMNNTANIMDNGEYIYIDGYKIIFGSIETYNIDYNIFQKIEI